MAKVRIPQQLRPEAAGERELYGPGKTVLEVFDSLRENYPRLVGRVIGEGGEIHRYVNVYVDDDDIRYIGGLGAAVEDGSVISLIPAVAGGV